jgi:hypothetical protein
MLARMLEKVEHFYNSAGDIKTTAALENALLVS